MGSTVDIRMYSAIVYRWDQSLSTWSELILKLIHEYILFSPPNCMYLCSLKAWKLAWNLEIVCAYIIILTFSEIFFICDYINIGLRRQIVQILHYKLHRVVRVMFLLSLFWVFPRAPQAFHCHLHWPVPLSLFCSSKRLDVCSFNKYYLRSFRCQALFWV